MMLSEFRITTRIVTVRRHYLGGHLALTVPGVSRRLVLPDGRVFADINRWVTRRKALEQLALI